MKHSWILEGKKKRISSYCYNFVINITSESLIKLLLLDEIPPSVPFESNTNKDAGERPPKFYTQTGGHLLGILNISYPLGIYIVTLEFLVWSFIFWTFEIFLKFKKIDYLLATDFSYLSSLQKK